MKRGHNGAHGRAVDTILRFHPSERHLHWAIAIPFVICFVTAVVLVVVYNPHPGRPYRLAVSLVHRISGIGLIVGPPLVLLRHRLDYRIHLYNIKQGWIWTFSDVKWLCLMGLAAVSERFQLPDQGKFNAAEKLNFMMVMTFYPLLIITGVSIWLPGVDLVAWVVHFALAALATPLMVGHVFMATVNPGTRVGLPGMITGHVDRQWAMHHYADWYREQYQADREQGRPERQAVVPEPEPIIVPCRACPNHYSVAPWEDVLREAFSTDATRCPHCGAVEDALTVVMELPQLHLVLAALERGGGGGPARSLH